MSDGIDPLKDVFGVSDREKQAIQAAMSIIGSVSSVWGSINTIKSVLSLLGILDQPTSLVEEMRALIDQLVKDFDGVVAALDKEQSMRAVADQLARARAQLLNLTEFAPEHASEVGVDATWDALRAGVLNESLEAVLALGDQAYWKRVFFPQLLYQKWPPGETHPQPAVDADPGIPSGLVFDYRLTLPAYLEAVSIRVTILAAVVKDYRRVAVPELTQMIGTLERYFEQIRSGITEIMWVPSDVVDTSDNPSGGVPTWVQGGAMVGAVEIYSACDRVAQWPSDEFPRVDFPGAGTADAATKAKWFQFLVRYAVRNWVRWKQLYDLAGLNAMAQAIVALKRMAGISPATLPAPDVGPNEPTYTGRKIRGGDYSLTELARMLHDIGAYGQWGIWPILDAPTGELKAPVSLRELLSLLQTFRAQPYTSFRDALQQ